MNSNVIQYQYVYLLRTREFIRLEENVFKIGRTAKLMQRFSQYPRSSELIRFKKVKDSVWVEKKIIELFTEKFIRKMEYGLEWFEGDPNLMIVAFEEIACKYEHEVSDLRQKIMNKVLTHISSDTSTTNNSIECKCGHSFSTNFSLQRHLSSRTHELNMLCVGENIISDENGMYACGICNYSTEFKGNFRKHVLSESHKRQTTPLVSNDNVMLTEVISALIKQHEHQSNQQMELLKKFADRLLATTEQKSSSVSASDHSSIQNTHSHNPTTTTNSHNTTTNKKFNLNFFLNEECKNAMNLSDFIKGIVVNME
jgi:hypothetical protein